MVNLSDGKVTRAAAAFWKQGATVPGSVSRHAVSSAKFARWQVGWFRIEGYRDGLVLSPEERGKIVRRIEFRGRIVGWLAGWLC
jgi:hypothetical protein